MRLLWLTMADGGKHNMKQTAAAERRAEPRAFSANKDWLRALQRTARIEQDPCRILAVAFDEIAAERGDAIALLSDAENFTFRELAQRSLRYARWALAQGLTKGDAVALVMENRAEYIAVWLGLNRIGVIVALINVNLVGGSLAHCLRVADPRLVIASRHCRERCETALREGDLSLPLFIHGDEAFERALLSHSDAPLVLEEDARPTITDHALYIYTSGTTGLPKAAIVSHRRIMNWALWFNGLADITADDRMYNCLPLYHSVGGVVAVWSPLLSGGSVAIRERFSLSAFWREIVEFDCTLIQYIGELCRYLVNAPLGEAETTHRLRMAIGNGLRPEVWRPFARRFAIPRILEFYGATESNFSLYNVEGEPGAIGRIPAFLAARQQLRLVKFDAERDDILRGDDGYCRLCATDEAGEAIARIAAREGAAGDFDGYLNRAESEKKILRNVFELGDAWMRSGDLMRRDARGFYYFVDRIGDTFRWKGENVSTAEVAQVIAEVAGVRDVTVYGVEVPGCDGRAGMASIVAADAFDLTALRTQLDARLAPYAHPLFLRIMDRLETTDTFKHRKRDLAKQGFDPRDIAEPIYVALPDRSIYDRIDATLFREICAGAFQL